MGNNELSSRIRSLVPPGVILVSYPICKATERLPAGSLLNPGRFSPKEHVLVMTTAIAGSLAGTLGLSGGMLALSLDFGTRLTISQIFIWALVAGFFGIFFGTCFFRSLVLPDELTWPFARANAAFIAAFYKNIHEAGDEGTSDTLKVFGAFCGVVFVWFAISPDLPRSPQITPSIVVFP